MSEIILRLPSSYVDVERDEMEYVDGGGFAISTFKQSYKKFHQFLYHILVGRAAVISRPLAIPLAVGAGLGTAGLVRWMGSGVRFK